MREFSFLFYRPTPVPAMRARRAAPPWSVPSGKHHMYGDVKSPAEMRKGRGVPCSATARSRVRTAAMSAFRAHRQRATLFLALLHGLK